MLRMKWCCANPFGRGPGGAQPSAQMALENTLGITDQSCHMLRLSSEAMLLCSWLGAQADASAANWGQSIMPYDRRKKQRGMGLPTRS